MFIRTLRRHYTADDGQPSGGSPPPAAVTPPATGSGATPPATGGEEPQDLTGLRTLVDKLRRFEREAEPQLKELKRLKDAQAARDRESQTEAERLRADHEAEKTARTAAEQALTSAQSELRSYRLRDAIEAAVSSATLPAGEGQEPQPNPLHGVSPRLAARLLDHGAIQWGEDGRPQPASVRRALAQALEDFPEIRPTTTTAAVTPTTPTPFPAQRAASGGPPPAKPDAANSHIKSKYKPPTVGGA